MSPNTPTTLITFRVRAPPSTNRLDLYGSWDNFTKGYSMSKDLQTGSEYWHGCFNFSNIICDGRPSDHMKPREGGLRMGGTYWYHYKINDETDFHNVCERATSHCPMLPGQLINVLNIPYAFSGNRSRNPSTSSTSSERRTMDPQDRFMNPRPAPARPAEKARVATSPIFEPLPRTDQELAIPRMHLPKKPSLDVMVGGGAGTALAGGLRAAFRARTARSQSPEAKATGLEPAHGRAGCAERSRAHSPETRPRPARGLLFRSASDDNIPTMSFEEHRRQKSHSREPSTLRHAVSSDALKSVEPLTLVNPLQRPVNVPKEEASGLSSPTSRTKAADEPNLEKRLPTLPNTPSSAYPPSLMHESPARQPLNLDNLDSHFSATTIDTQYQPISKVFGENSHFSAWTVSTSATYIDSEAMSPIPDVPELPKFPVLSEAVDIPQRKKASLEEAPMLDTCLPSSFSFSSLSSSVATTPSTSFLDVDIGLDIAEPSSRLSAPYSTHFQHYTLPEDEFSSQITLKGLSQEPARGRSRHAVEVEQTTVHERDSEIVHSESMQKLLEELSYLSGVIRT